MKLSIIFLFIMCLIGCQSFQCFDKDCTRSSTKYESYIDCIRSRTKRHTCNDNEEDCEVCTCKTLHCCRRTCNANCESSSCKTSCSEDCKSTVSEKGQYSFSQTNTVGFKHNITTIVHLHNIINNTNVIDVPIHINNTNLNNITVPETSGNTGNAENKCCYISKPENCVHSTTSPYLECQANRQYHCGLPCLSAGVSTHGQTQPYYQNFGYYSPQFFYPRPYSYNPFFTPNYLPFSGFCPQPPALQVLPFLPSDFSKYPNLPFSYNNIKSQTQLSFPHGQPVASPYVNQIFPSYSSNETG